MTLRPLWQPRELLGLAAHVPRSSEDSAISSSTILEGRATPADFTAAASAALLPLALDQEGPAPPELSARSGFVVALCFAIAGSRASPTVFATVVTSAGRVVCSGPRTPRDLRHFDNLDPRRNSLREHRSEEVDDLQHFLQLIHHLRHEAQPNAVEPSPTRNP